MGCFLKHSVQTELTTTLWSVSWFWAHCNFLLPMTISDQTVNWQKTYLYSALCCRQSEASYTQRDRK